MKDYESNTQSPTIKISVFADLVFHVLALVRCASSDASSLYNEKYAVWSVGSCGKLKGLLDRTRLNTVESEYSLAAKGFLLSLYSQLWEKPEDFQAVRQFSLQSVKWESDVKAMYADMLIHNCHRSI